MGLMLSSVSSTQLNPALLITLFGRLFVCVPEKNGVVESWCGYLSGARCRLAYGPADATATRCLLYQ